MSHVYLPRWFESVVPQPYFLKPILRSPSHIRFIFPVSLLLKISQQIYELTYNKLNNNVQAKDGYKLKI